MFMGVTPTILRPLSVLSAILKPQDVVAILAQPANQMQAAINALPFSPDILIGNDRVATGDWAWRDSLRGLNLTLASNTTAAEAAWPGYSGTNNRIEYAFKQTPGVIWRVTWAGDGTSNRQIPHGLGVVPGMVIVKQLNSSAENWPVTHRSLTSPFVSRLFLNLTASETTPAGVTFNGASATTFTVGSGSNVNASGGIYVAYLFAHDPSADGIVQCGSFTADGAGDAGFALPWASQFLKFKLTSTTSDWIIADTTRGATYSSARLLRPNTSGAETTETNRVSLNSNGIIQISGLPANASGIFAAIRAPY